MGIKTVLKSSLVLIAVFAVALLAGCGGGGGGAPAPVSGVSANKGLVRANVSFTESASRKAYLAARTAGKTAEQTSSQIVVIEIAITGYYSEDGTEFDPITAMLEIDLATGYGTVSVTEVPIGYNHILTAVATWPDGSTDTVMGLIYEVAAGVTTDATADEETTAVVNAALAYAAAAGVPLSEVSNSTILSLEDAVAQLAAQGIPYSEMTPDAVAAFLDVAELDITPATATVVLGGQQMFTATVTGSDGLEITDVLVAWSCDSSIGQIDSGGLFTASGVGAGIITASINDLVATASVTVDANCVTDADCDDSNPATIDTCMNPGTQSATCSNAAVACSADADCDDGANITIDTCVDPGTEISYCDNYPVQCATDADCTSPATVCIDGGTMNALCIECLDDADCSAPTPACLEGGLATSTCVECIDDLDCDDADPITWDVCEFGGTTSSYCEFLSPQLGSDILIADSPSEIIMSGDESTLYVSPAVLEVSTSSIYLIDTMTNSVVGAIDVPDGIDAIALDNSRNQMILSYVDNLVVVDLSSETIVQTVNLTTYPYYNIVVAQDTDKLVTNTLNSNSTIDALDLSNLAAPAVSIPSSLYPESPDRHKMAVDEANSKVIVPAAYGEIGIIDLSGMTESQVLASTLAASEFLAQAVVGKNTDTAYVTSISSSVLISVDTVNETILGESVVSATGYGTGGLGLVEDAGHLFIDESGNARVLVNSASSLQTLCSVDIPTALYGEFIAVDHTNRQVYISDRPASVIHVIQYVSGGTSCVECDPTLTTDEICCDGEVDAGLGSDCNLGGGT